MDEIYIDMRNQNQWIRKYFVNKDLVTIEDLLGVIEDLDYEVGVLNEKIEDMEQDIKDNYKPISHWEEYGLNPNDYH